MRLFDDTPTRERIGDGVTGLALVITGHRLFLTLRRARAAAGSPTPGAVAPRAASTG